MRDFLIDVVNHRFVITASIVILAGAAFLTFQDGFQVVDAVLLVAVAAALFIVWRVLVSRNTEGIASVKAYQDALQNGQRPTLVEFYSAYCAGCLAMKPIVDQLESEAGDRLQIIRLNIDTEPGRTLIGQYQVLFTPTFFYFDRNGTKLRDSVLVLDRNRIMYDLENAPASR